MKSIRSLYRENMFLFWLILPIVLLVIGSLIMIPQIRPSIFPITEFTVNGGPSDTNLELNLWLNSLPSGTVPKDFTVEYDVEYYIMSNSSRKPDYVSMTSIHGFAGGFGTGFQGNGTATTLFFYDGKKAWWVDYNVWSFTSNSEMSLVSSDPSYFPFETYDSPIILFWTSSNVSPTIRLRSGSLSGYVLSLRPLGRLNNTYVWQQFDLGQRLFMGLPSFDISAFQVIAQKDPSSLAVYSVYFAFIFFAIYYPAALSRLSRIPLNQKIQTFVGLSIAVVAFLWTIRQVAESLTYVEILIMGELLTWVFLEVVGMLKHHKRNHVLDKWL